MVGDASNLTRYQPRQAALAAQSEGLQDQRVVAAVKKNENRRKLPRTQVDYYQQRMDQPR